MRNAIISRFYYRLTAVTLRHLRALEANRQALRWRYKLLRSLRRRSRD